MTKTQKFTAMGMLLVTMGMVGCAPVITTGGGSGPTTVFANGKLEATLEKSLDAVYAAAAKAVDQLQLATINKEKESLEANILARNAQDKKITVEITKLADNLTKVVIHVGGFGGDQAQSQAIMQKINANL